MKLPTHVEARKVNPDHIWRHYTNKTKTTLFYHSEYQWCCWYRHLNLSIYLIIPSIISSDSCRLKNFWHYFILSFLEVLPLYEGHLATKPLHIHCILRYSLLHFLAVYFLLSVWHFCYSFVPILILAFLFGIYFLSFMFKTFFGILN